jgi:hypothetical protein
LSKPLVFAVAEVAACANTLQGDTLLLTASAPGLLVPPSSHDFSTRSSSTYLDVMADLMRLLESHSRSIKQNGEFIGSSRELT